MKDKIIVVNNGNIGSYFRQLRENTGFTQSDTDRKTGVSQQLISILEKSGLRSGTRWDGVSKLLDFYAKNGSPSLFALIYQNGKMIEKFPEVYVKPDSVEEKLTFKQQLRDLLERIDDTEL